MNAKKTLFTFLLCAAFYCGFSQQRVLTLPEALRSAENNLPSLQQRQLLRDISRENQSLLDASLYPQVNANGQATYQSEVTKLEAPGFPSGFGQKPDNYNLGADLRFPLTQFGTVKTRKQLEEAQTNLSLSQLDVDVQRTRERVTNLVGNAVLQNSNTDILRLRLNDLDSQRRKVAVGVANGAVLRSNQLVLESEILSTQQRLADVQATVSGLASELSVLTGLPLDTTTRFDLGNEPLVNQPVNRPELRTFAAQRQVLDVRSELLRKETRPNVYVFGQGFYGRPGYNFLNTDMRLYGIGGLGLSWNINNLFNQSRQQRVIELNRQIVGTQEATFNQNLQASLAEKSAEIGKYQTILANDQQIVANRQQILRAASSQLENGVITSTEYLQELNALNTAQLNLRLHQVQLALARAQYNILLGY